MAARNRTIGSDAVNFPKPRIDFGVAQVVDERPDEVIVPDDRWNWRTHMKKPVPITPASPYSRPSPLGAYTPEEDEYIGGLEDHYNRMEF